MAKSKPTSEESSMVLRMMGEEIRAGRNPENVLYILPTGNFKVVRIDGSPEDDYSRSWEIVKVSRFPSKVPKKQLIFFDEVDESLLKGVETFQIPQMMRPPRRDLLSVIKIPPTI